MQASICGLILPNLICSKIAVGVYINLRHNSKRWGCYIAENRFSSEWPLLIKHPSSTMKTPKTLYRFSSILLNRHIEKYMRQNVAVEASVVELDEASDQSSDRTFKRTSCKARAAFEW